MIDRNDLRQLEKAMTRAVFRGVFWAILLTSIVGATLWAIWVVIYMNTYATGFDRL